MLSIKAIFVFILLLVATSVFAQSKSVFCKKWKIDKYIYWGISFAPEANEKNDFIRFEEDNTFVSFEKGKKETGEWYWDASRKTIFIYDEAKADSFPLVVISYAGNKLVLLVKDEKDSIKIQYVGE